jgi:hypothetical protein
MRKILRTIWLHLVIWGLMALYLFVAPGIYDHLFVIEGNPIQANVKLPATFSGSKSSVDALVIYNELDGVYQVMGWAFPTTDKSILLGDYERQVVLATPTRNYIFALETVERTDVQVHFNDLGTDLTDSGFSAFIASHALAPGAYSLGLIFKNILIGTTYYIDTGRCVARTPNDFVLKNPGVACQSSAAGDTGQPVQVNVKLPIEILQAQSGVDSLVKSSVHVGVYQLLGWAFPTVDKSIPASDYERQVVLVTPKGNYIFAADAVERTDVQKDFSDLGMDVNVSGFSAFINGNALKAGLYGIGLIFKNTASGTTYYIDTARCVTRTSNNLVLETPGNSACQSLTSGDTGQPVQVNVKLPVEVSQAQSGVEALVKSSTQGGVYQLWGWAFPTVDKSIPASDYDRQVVLVTSKGNYVFAAEPVERTDVQKYFINLGMDVTMSGISAFINGNTLKPGIYGIGLIFKNTSSGATVYINAGRCLQRTANVLSLEKPGSSICQSP